MARRALVAVDRLAAGRDDAYTGEAVEDWLAEAGFVDCETRDADEAGTQAVVGRRERGVD